MVPCTTYDFLVNFIEDVERDSARTSVSFSRSPGHTVRESWSVGVVVDGNKLSESNHIIPFGHLGRNLWKYKIKCIAQSPTDPTNCYLSFYTYDSLLIPETVYNDIVNIITSPDFQTNANAYIQNPFIYDPAGIEAKAERAKNLAGTNTKLPAFKKPPLDTRLGQRLTLSSNAQIILDPNVRYSIELNNTIQKVSAEANVQGTSGVYTWPNQTGPSLEDLDNYAREHGQRQSKLHDFMASNSATTSVGREEEERIWTADDVNITGCVKGVLLSVEFKRYFDRQYSAAEIQELIANEQTQLEKDAKKKDKPASDEKRKSALWKDFFELQKAINTIRYDGKPLKILYTNSGRFTPDIVKDKLDPLGTKRDRLDKQRMYQGLFNPTDTTTNA